MWCSTVTREYTTDLSHETNKKRNTLMTQYTRDNSPGGTTQKHKIEQPQTLIPTGPSQHRSGHPPKGTPVDGRGGRTAGKKPPSCQNPEHRAPPLQNLTSP